MNHIMLNQELKIEDMIFPMRGQQVILDSDLAKLYGVETKRINEAVKNNPRKFPERFSWELTNEEYNELRSKFSTTNLSNMSRTNPKVFTEQGVAMLATILKSQTAIEVSIRIMDAFVLMRHFIVENKDIYKSLNHIHNQLIEHDEKIHYLFSKFDKKEQLFLPGETYDAYSSIIHILTKAKEEIVIIDNYADKTILDMIKNMDAYVTVITSKRAKLTSLEVEKFNKQYDKLRVIYDNTFHDRYLILDRKEVYHMGASLNHAGEKIFSINHLKDKMIKEHLLSYTCQIMNEDSLTV